MNHSSIHRYVFTVWHLDETQLLPYVRTLKWGGKKEELYKLASVCKCARARIGSTNYSSPFYTLHSVQASFESQKANIFGQISTISTRSMWMWVLLCLCSHIWPILRTSFEFVNASGGIFSRRVWNNFGRNLWKQSAPEVLAITKYVNGISNNKKKKTWHFVHKLFRKYGDEMRASRWWKLPKCKAADISFASMVLTNKSCSSVVPLGLVTPSYFYCIAYAGIHATLPHHRCAPQRFYLNMYKTVDIPQINRQTGTRDPTNAQMKWANLVLSVASHAFAFADHKHFMEIYFRLSLSLHMRIVQIREFHIYASALLGRRSYVNVHAFIVSKRFIVQYTPFVTEEAWPGWTSIQNLHQTEKCAVVVFIFVCFFFSSFFGIPENRKAFSGTRRR